MYLGSSIEKQTSFCNSNFVYFISYHVCQVPLNYETETDFLATSSCYLLKKPSPTDTMVLSRSMAGGEWSC